MKIAYPDNRQAKRMVRTQIQARGIHDDGVLEVMSRVPRHRFVPGESTFEAYGDFPLSIGHGQTISQPYMVALMTEELHLRGGERVLEIGTGSGYQTAVLAELAGEIYTVELIPELSERSQKLLEELGYSNIIYRSGDGSLGWPEHAPYDRILVAAAAVTVPRPLTSQLADNGILVIPVGDSRHYQTLLIVRRVGRRLDTRESIGCRFVPLVQKA
ncbi:MAG: protein-L-isoaspartate(D-aspartate) O-methyltransferase [Spirochaetaceae bacterium]|nr:MAG: protein-L-isoaspartate(D-aspartate) O-methyltransferase [Spirochaetaceae bacterium]